MAMKLTNPGKVIYQEDDIDKQELWDYYQEIHSWILPYIKNRPLSLVRCPDTYTRCFYQKHLDKEYSEFLHSILIKEKSQKKEYIYITNKNGLLVFPQLGVLEIHPWGSKVKDIEYPDMLIFDLDPAENLPWKKVVAAAKEMQAFLKELKLRSFVKTTGGKGLHVVVPIKPNYHWDEVKNFSHACVQFIMLRSPELYVTKMTKSLRTGKIFLDYLRNQRGATAIAPYSTRAKIHAPVSTPLHWDELTNDIRDTQFTLKTIPKRLQAMKNDPWKDFFKIKQSLRIEELIRE
jgi:bifunctional non-homologous end joining protein LigD